MDTIAMYRFESTVFMIAKVIMQLLYNNVLVPIETTSCSLIDMRHISHKVDSHQPPQTNVSRAQPANKCSKY